MQRDHGFKAFATLMTKQGLEMHMPWMKREEIRFITNEEKFAHEVKNGDASMNDQPWKLGLGMN